MGDEINKIEYGKLLQAVSEMHDDIREIKADVKKQNSRVGKLENWRWYLLGLLGTGAGGIGITEIFLR